MNMIDRRKFLEGALGTGAASLATLPGSTGLLAAPQVELFAATRKSDDGEYSAAIFRADGSDVNAVGLPSRGHDVAICHKTQTCVAFARRPGNFAVAFRRDKKWTPVNFTTPPDRHFYGHGVFSPDGRLLFATENDFDAGRGTIGIYDATNGFKRIGEFDAHGIGPHDLALLPDGHTIVIANGGIETHPEVGGGRTKLNLATMTPSLVYLDMRSGGLIEKHELPSAMHSLSLRHLDVGANRQIVIGGQLQNMNAQTPLIFRHRLGEDLKPVAMEKTLEHHLRGYISSVAVNGAGDIAAVTSSHGGFVVFLDVATGRVKGSKQIADASGVAPCGGDFLISTGLGDVLTPGHSEKTVWHWDNHAARL